MIIDFKYSLIILIPCYNETTRMEARVFEDFMIANEDVLLFFIDDGSTDNTKLKLERELHHLPNFRLFPLSENMGKAEAIRLGVLHCLKNFHFDLIGFADADLATPLTEFLLFRTCLERRNEINIILGSRIQMLGKNIKRNLLRHWFSRIIATGIGKVLNEPVYDSQCGAKVFRRETAMELFSDYFMTKWLFDVELLSRYKVNYGSEVFKKTILEIPVSQWIEKPNSKVRYHYVFRLFYDLLIIKRKYFHTT